MPGHLPPVAMPKYFLDLINFKLKKKKGTDGRTDLVTSSLLELLIAANKVVSRISQLMNSINEEKTFNLSNVQDILSFYLKD